MPRARSPDLLGMLVVSRPMGTTRRERHGRHSTSDSGAEWDRSTGARREHSDLSVSRDALVKKGLIFAPDRGLLQFTVPHMDDYIRRQYDS